MRYWPIILLLLSCGELPSGPDTSHPLYVNDPDRIYFKNIRSLSYRIVQEDPSAQTNYVLKGLPTEDFPLSGIIRDRWLESQAELSLQLTTTNASAWTLSGEQSGDWVPILTDTYSKTGYGLKALELLQEHLNIGRPLRLTIQTEEDKILELSTGQSAYLALRSCLQDYFRLLGER
ncbi:MAG: hypothetical protein AAF433_03365 [Bacteroidota bacterium]